MTRRVPLPAEFLRHPIAHRGYHDKAARRAENAAAAFRAAIDAGYGIELDVQLSADGEAMVFHDDTLDRMTAARGPVQARAASDLCGIRLNDSDDTIPALPEVLALVRGRVPLLIELKDMLATMTPTSGRLEQAVASALAGYAGPVAVMSFNPHCVAAIAQAAPEIPRGLTTERFSYVASHPLPRATCDRLRQIPDYEPTGSGFISHSHGDLASPRVAALRSQGAAVLCWTIRSPRAEAAARRIADNITFEGYAAAIPA